MGMLHGVLCIHQRRGLERHRSGQAEIHNLGMAALGYEDVCRLDVAMNNALRMGGIEGVRDIESDLQKAMQLHRLAADEMFQGDAIQKLHDDEGLIVIVVNLMDGADVGMVQGRSCARLAAKARQGQRIVSDLGRQKLDGHEASQLEVLGLIDHAHAAAAEFFHNAVVGNGLVDHRRRKTPLAGHVRDRRQASQCLRASAVISPAPAATQANRISWSQASCRHPPAPLYRRVRRV